MSKSVDGERQQLILQEVYRKLCSKDSGVKKCETLSSKLKKKLVLTVSVK